MRTIHTDEITKCIKEMCMQVNVDLSPDVKDALLAGERRIDNRKTDFGAVGEKLGNCERKPDSDLSGYRYDRCIFTHRTGSSY